MKRKFAQSAWYLFLAIATTGAFLWALWRIGVFSFSGSEAASKVIVAGISLIGVFLTTSVALAGVLIKRVLDDRAEGRLQAESGNNQRQAAATEARLKLEAGISAVQLFANSDGTPSLPIQRAGALSLLSSLGHHALALALTTALMRSKELDPAIAARIIGEALLSGDHSVERYAVNLFVAQSPQLLTPTGFEAPEPVLDGCRECLSYTRMWAAIGIVNLLAARELPSWKTEHPYSLNAAIAALVLLWDSETDTDVRQQLAAILRAALEVLPRPRTLQHHTKVLEVESVYTAIRLADTSKAHVVAAIDRLRSLGQNSTSPSPVNPRPDGNPAVDHAPGAA